MVWCSVLCYPSFCHFFTIYDFTFSQPTTSPNHTHHHHPSTTPHHHHVPPPSHCLPPFLPCRLTRHSRCWHRSSLLRRVGTGKVGNCSRGSNHLHQGGVVWCGVVRCGVVWCGAVWCGVVWCGVVWCGVVWCGVVWCGVVWCGIIIYGDNDGEDVRMIKKMNVVMT